MHTGRNRDFLGHFVATLTFTLAMAASSVAGATALSAPASATPIPSTSQMMGAGYTTWSRGGGVVSKDGNTAGYAAHVSPLLFSAGAARQRNKGCKWCAWRGSGFGATNSLTRGTASARSTRRAAMVSTSFVPTPSRTGPSSANASDAQDDVSAILVADAASASTNNVGAVRNAGTGISALATGMRWRSNSFSIAGSRIWSKVIKFTDTGVALRVPLN
jgi:hypothetical protein